MSIYRTLFEKGKKTPNVMRVMAMVYNLVSFDVLRVKGRNNKINRNYAFLRKNRITIKGNNNHIELGLGTRVINCQIDIQGNNHRLYIGDNCYCKNSGFAFEDNDCLIKLGFRSNSLGVHFAVTEPNSEIIVGENCLFSSDVEIRTGDSHSIIDLNSNKRINFAKDVIIEDHVWIGAHVRMLKGSKISKDSIVANSAVVTKRFDIPNCIIGGFPAKIIKQDINWNNERTYEEGSVKQ